MSGIIKSRREEKGNARKERKMKKIEKAVMELGLIDKKVFTMAELDAICEKSGMPLLAVMKYLRCGRK